MIDHHLESYLTPLTVMKDEKGEWKIIAEMFERYSAKEEE
jgi:hypothetical protein